MHIKDIHFNIKRKLNKVDSNQYRNILVPTIDTVVNEAIDMFIKMVAFPKYSTLLGFEKNQRTRDDIFTLIESEDDAVNQLEVVSNLATLPADYMFYIGSHILADKKNCTNIKIIPTVVQHDDTNSKRDFYKSSFEWRRVNAKFDSKGIRFENDGSFNITKFCLSYIRKPKYVHNAEAFRAEGYELPSGTLLVGYENCELPDHTHTEIVDLAVMLLTGEIKAPGFEQTIAKLKMNQLI